ncbi:PadR family transcriptional regulator [Weissella koreensis]|uniref:PadR family transcriptional regulator n=1 Tax=Weissella koreensis TaxID=165096 RepID=A0A7H1MKN4_9LACO|nr:PadR family transcriptional regulator [Weissella koreensis]AEJ23173.1 PadR family transcriptional regulator [Weissella koreensis KACC 15510]AVH74817.1 PadR family transcriptional regulator [Weissella koreensis]EJF33774.1 PadR family transcriptional regulator [Weissella koreensis KCTC 3621]MCZ9310678.1 PadR family transcriptional regulator [Weissella koreensis]QGN20041.1 PadR family transcriptional regulator [Weissella koreensis]
MNIKVPTVILDGTVLALLDEQDLYGYAITKQVQQYLNVSESTMYPVLRRLQKDQMLTTYDEPFEGRNRRYYQITKTGKESLQNIKETWRDFSSAVDTLLLSTENGGGTDA